MPQEILKAAQTDGLAELGHEAKASTPNQATVNHGHIRDGRSKACEIVSCSCMPALLVDVGRQLDKGHSPFVMVGDRIPTLTERLQDSIQKQVEPFNGVRLSPER